MSSEFETIMDREFSGEDSFFDKPLEHHRIIKDELKERPGFSLTFLEYGDLLRVVTAEGVIDMLLLPLNDEMRGDNRAIKDNDQTKGLVIRSDIEEIWPSQRLLLIGSGSMGHVLSDKRLRQDREFAFRRIENVKNDEDNPVGLSNEQTLNVQPSGHEENHGNGGSDAVTRFSEVGFLPLIKQVSLKQLDDDNFFTMPWIPASEL